MKRKVLVIEDEPIIGEMMSILLEIEGYRVISLGDTKVARRKLHNDEVGLVMLDLNLGGEDGRTMCAYIKAQADLKHIPVILVSANSDLDKIKDECGADDVIHKPFGIDLFVGKVKDHSSQLN